MMALSPPERGPSAYLEARNDALRGEGPPHQLVPLLCVGSLVVV